MNAIARGNGDTPALVQRVAELDEDVDAVDARAEVSESADGSRYALDIGEDHINVVTQYTTNVQDAPCHSPPRSMVSIRLT